MSVVFLSSGPPTGTLSLSLSSAHTTLTNSIYLPVSPEALKTLSTKFSVSIPQSSFPHYLHLLNGLDASTSLISSLPLYTDPRLLPNPSTLPRKYEALGGDKGKNPTNGWSHRTEITSASPTSTSLSGKTVAFKDNVSIAQIPITGGTTPALLTGGTSFPVPGIDASIVRRVLECGGTVAGSANCEHFSMSPLSFTSASGPVHNAWLHGYTTGGSSSGCAALVGITAVAAWRKRHNVSTGPNSNEDVGLGSGVDMAIGGDQGGSVRIPASYAGIYGLKPTHGLVPYTGIISLFPMIDHVGPMTVTLEDNMVLLGVVAGWDGMDSRATPGTPMPSSVPDYSGLVKRWIDEKSGNGEWTAKSAGTGLRVGVVKEGVEGLGLSDEVRRVITAAITQFKGIGAVVEEVSIPMHSLGPSIWTVVTRPGIGSYGLENKPAPILNYPMPDISPPVFDQAAFDVLDKHNPAVVNMVFNSAFLNERKDVNQLVGKSMTLVQQLRDEYDKALERFDVLLTPVNPRVGSRHPEYGMSVQEKMEPAIGATLNTCQFNVTGHPALSLPAGWGKAPDGPGMLPVGMQLVAKHFDELSIFKVAAAWEVAGKGLDKWNGQLN
ncbi:amidase signature domain-containing protein [Clohesyomyces aquaticus]|uniref:Amidase signature domain-containing protein n=1 Tax=Clohesyomyces aquaticus TaxID=1231657 RepID=A0A1Y1ZP73_9PLEO|nr:amidase signature domain-containing protein [Clohesyomyces aquaticus]